MRQINRSQFLTLIILLNFGIGKIYGQQEIGAFDLTENWYTRSLNPAIVPDEKKLHIGLLAGSMDAWSNTGLSLNQYNNYFGGNLSKNHYNYLLIKLYDRSKIALDQRINTLSIGFKIKDRYFLSLMHAFRLHAGATVPKDLPQLILSGNGNENFLDKDINIAPGIKILGWQDIRFGLSRKFGNLEAGVGLNYLLGSFTTETDPAKSQISVYTDSEDFGATVKNGYRLWSSNLLESFNFQNLSPGISYVDPVLVAGTGYAFDAGVSWKLNKYITLSGSVLDLGGRIEWKKNTYSFSINNEFTYEGGEIESGSLLKGSDGLQLSDAELNRLNETFTFQRSTGLFSSTIPTRYYGRILCNLSPRLSMHLTYFRQVSSAHNQNSIGLGTKLKLVKWLTLGVNVVSGGNREPEIGFNLMLNPGPLQLFVSSDNYKSITLPSEITRFNLRTGISFTFGKPKIQEKER